jgi:hypothetical protein
MTIWRQVEERSRSLITSRVWRPPLAVLNISVMTASLLLVAFVYRGIEGQGDDLGNLNPAAHPTEWHYLKMLYTQWGQVGFGVLMVPLRLFVRVFGVGPDAFPWWCFAGLNAALNVLSAIHFVLAGRALVGYSRSSTVGLTAFLAGIWLFNPVSFSTTVGIPVVFFAAYTLPLYMISLVALGFATAPTRAARSRIVVLSAVYLLISLNEATFMLSLPVLISAFTIVRARRAARPVQAFAGMIFIWAIASAAAATFVWTTPGFHLRAPLLGFAVPSGTTLWDRIPAWYVESVRTMYGALAGGDVSGAVLLHTILLACLCTALILQVVSKNWWRRAHANSGWLVDGNILALGYLIAAHAATSTLLFTPYFPEYTKAYPVLLIALGIGTTIVWVADLIESLGALGKASPARPVGAAILLVCVGVWTGVRAWPDVVHAYREELRASATLRQARQDIVMLYRDTGQATYTLSHCPPRLEAYGGAALSTDYFTWRGLPALSAMQEGKGDPTALSQRPASTRVMCAAPVLVPWRWSGVPASSPAAVRVFSFIAADGSGVETHDFLASESPRSCTVSGSYNPNVGGSALYRNVFEYRVFFSTGYSYALSPPSVARLVTVVANGHAVSPVNPSVSIAVGYAGVGNEVTAEIPLDPVGARDGVPALLRVSLRGLFPGYLTANTSVRLACE